MTSWLRALLFFSLPATAISALGIYHKINGSPTEKSEDCCKKCPEKCKNKDCCKNGKCCLQEEEKCSEDCTSECCKCCKKAS